jgi:RimJ/RimL family protein N-acetyltransferase
MKKIIETKRLYLRQFSPEDAQQLFELSSNPQVMQYMSQRDRNSTTLEQTATMVKECIQHYSLESGLGVWPTILKEGEKFTGWTLLKNLEKTEEIEIGYRYFPRFWGQGLCTEISLAVLKYGFTEVGLDRIVGISHPQNKASIRVLEKIGLKYEKDAHYYEMDVLYYALNREDFR